MSAFIRYESITETKAQITWQHNLPLDQEHGIKKADGSLYSSQDELLQTFSNSKFVDDIPETQPPEGQSESGLYINPQTGEMWYEYADIPKSQEQIIAELQNANGLIPPVTVPTTLEDYKQNKIYELSKACEEEILAGFYSECRGSREWYTNSRDDQSNIIGQATLATLNPAIIPQWKSANEPICTDFTLAQITQLATDGAAFKTERIKTFETLKVAVLVAGSIEAVEAIAWTQKVW